MTLTANGKDQSVSGTAVDFAGNTASASLGGINIDSEKPAITVNGIKDGAMYILGAVPTPSCSATDDLSGAGTCVVKVSGGEANGVGTFTYTATSSDKAGNTQTATGSYRVVYRWVGFLQPINDTAHETGVNPSKFKPGRPSPRSS